MRNRHSETPPPTQDPRRPQPATGAKRGREQRSNHADMGATPAQDGEDVDVDDREIEDEETMGQPPRVEPSREDERHAQPARRTSSKSSSKKIASRKHS